MRSTAKLEFPCDFVVLSITLTFWIYVGLAFGIELLFESIGAVDGQGFVFGTNGVYRWFLFAFCASGTVLYGISIWMWKWVWCVRHVRVPERWVQSVFFFFLAASVLLTLNVTHSINFPTNRKMAALIVSFLFFLLWTIHRSHWFVIDVFTTQRDSLNVFIQILAFLHQIINASVAKPPEAIEKTQQNLIEITTLLQTRMREMHWATHLHQR